MSSRPLPLEELARLLPPKARLIGVDLGTKTIGLALSDVERRIGTPLLTIQRKKVTGDARQLAEQIARFEAFALIVGLPLNMDGSEGPRVQATRAFLRNFGALSATPFALWDERLSTAAVNRSLIENDVSRARRGRSRRPHGGRLYSARGNALDRLAAIGAQISPGQAATS